MAVALGRNDLYLQEYKKAIEHFDEVLTVRPQMADVYYYRACARYSLGQLTEAEDDCTKAIGYNPFHAEYFQLRGLCRLNRNNYKESVEDYSKVLQLSPRDEHSLFNRSLCYLELNLVEQAENDIDSLQRFFPDSYKLHLLRAQANLLKADTILAIANVDTLLRYNQFDKNALAFRGKLCLWEEDYSRADSFFSAAIERGGRFTENYLARAQARHALYRYNDALADYSEAILISPRSFVAHYNRGLLRALVGADNLAIEDFDFVLRVDSTNTLALYNRAILRERTGNFKGAEEDFTLLITEFPTFYAGYAARARIRRALGKVSMAASDETVVYKAELDMLFNAKKKKGISNSTIRNVRSLTQEDLEKYQQLLDLEAEEERQRVGLPPDFGIDNFQ